MAKIANESISFLRSKAKLVMIAVIAILCSATIYAAAATSDTITVEVDGVSSQVVTMRTDAEEILAQIGVEIGENDIVDTSEFVSGENSTIRVYKPHKFTIKDDGAEPIECIGNGTVGFALVQNGFTLKEGDIVNVSTEDMLSDNLEIVITRAFDVKIVVDNETVNVRLAGGKVSDAIDKAVITIDDDDIISVPLDSALEPDMFIRITRVETKVRVEKVDMKFNTITKKDNTMYTDQAKIEVKGVNGKQTITYHDRYINGELYDSLAVSSVIDVQPIDEVKIVGTKKRADSFGSTYILPNGRKTISTLKPPSTVQFDGNAPVSYKYKLVGTASAYSGPGRTATGKGVRPGYIAVNPKQIPYGTKMWIVSNDGKYVYGYASAEDTGGFTKWTGSRATICDLYFPDRASMNAFGRRSVTIYVL